MSTQILDGKLVASQIKAEVREQIEQLRKIHPNAKPPCLAVILCSSDTASKIYVKHKRKACDEVGIQSHVLELFEAGIENYYSPQRALECQIDWLNKSLDIHGILVQLPLLKGLDKYNIFDFIDPLKDVDCVSPTNVGLLLQARPRFIPCTPQGIQELLVRHGVEIAGKQVAVINRSDIVGKPLGALLLQDNHKANATVISCHDRTPPERLKEICLSSDIIVVAVGIPGFLTADMVSPGAVVVDVGINRIGEKVVGDVSWEQVSQKTSWISPVPGGVGACTVAALLKNTVQAYENSLKTF